MEPIKFSEAEKAALRAEYAPKATDDQWLIFINDCERRALIPGRHVYFRLQKASTFNRETQTWVDEWHPIMITSLEAMTLLADRTGKYNGQRPVIWYYEKAEGEGYIESKIPLGRICHAASVEILRKDLVEPAFGVARYDACVQTKGTGSDKKPNAVWEKRGEEMTAKCARAAAFRISFPEEIGKLYIAEELQDDAELQPVQVQTVVAQQPVTVPTPAVNQEAATETASPKPVNQDGTALRTALVEQIQTSPFPPEAHGKGMAGIDKLTTEINKPTEAQPKAPKAEEPKPVETQGSIFGIDEADEAATVGADLTPDPTPEPVAAAATSSTIAESPKPIESVPSTTPITSVAPAAPTGQPAGNLPTVPEYRAFTGRCTHMVRDVLQKAGKDGIEASSLFKPYLHKVTGKAKIEEFTVAEWEANLSALEAMKVPELIKLLRGK